MNVTIAKRTLVSALSRVVGVAERKSTMPILSTVLLDARDGSLRLAATDLYLSAVETVDAEVGSAGSFAVSAKDVLERVKNMPDGPVTLTVKDGSLMLSARGSARRYTLRGMPGEDFPPLPVPSEGAPSVTLAAATLSSLIARVEASISGDQTRAHLNSARFEWSGELLRMVSTDGHRMTKAELPAPGVASLEMLIPQKAVGELRRLCDEHASEDVELVTGGSIAFFRFGTSRFGVKLVDAQFPPYAQVIPKTYARAITIASRVLGDAVRAVALASEERTGGVALKFAKGLLEITSSSAGKGDGADEIAIDYDGPPVRIGVNAHYVTDALASVASDSARLEIGEDELSPIVFRSTDADVLCVVMPMRI